MTIILATQSGVTDGSGTGGIINEAARDIGILGKPRSSLPNNKVSALEDMKSAVNSVFSKLAGKTQSEQFDPSYVGTGKKTSIGSGIPLKDGNIPSIDQASMRQVINQTPTISVIIKKRAFSSLNHVYDPTLMDGAEKWLFRATKQLFSNKCAQIRDYELLSKIRNLDNIDTAQIASVFTTLLNDSQMDNFAKKMSLFSSAYEFAKLEKARKQINITTWFTEPDAPIIEELGFGTGVFETTLITNVSTSLSIDGNGSCSVGLQNPYNLMMVTDDDIELAIRKTSLSQITSLLNSAAGISLSTAQTNDSLLQKSRRERGKSSVTFTVNIGGGDASAVIDAIGYQLTKDNLDTVPLNYSLDDKEKKWFKNTLKNLKTYSSALSNDAMHGLSINPINPKLKEEVRYTRKMLRKFYLGKLMIQPMDQIHVYIDSGTRRAGEANDIDANNSQQSFGDAFKNQILPTIGSIMGLNDTRQVSDDLLKIAHEKYGSFLSFKHFKQLYLMSDGGTHVFAGLVSNTSGSYTASSGTYSVSINAKSNMEWLSISRYNKQPALHQTDGIMYDPLTPFKFETDPATGLPIGKPVLTDENQRILKNKFCQRQPGGPNKGNPVSSIHDLNTDYQVTGGSLSPIYDMPDGFKYRWKEGIITTTYTMSTSSPIDKTKVDERQLRRDVGVYAVNTPFATMDVANIISTLVTGFPYNPATFVESAINSTNFTLDTAINNRSDYFHSLLDIQKSLNLTHGNWSPYKRISTDRQNLARALTLQQRLSKRSSKMFQLRGQLAKIEDDIFRNEISKSTSTISENDTTIVNDAFLANREKVQNQLNLIENEFTKELTQTKELDNSSLEIKIAGNDVSFDMVNPQSKEDLILLGDELLFVTQRRKEEVIFNKDKNLFIVSDEYDRDFDIQAFNINMSGNNTNMWRSSWDSVLELCKRAAELIDFEFFVDTQGNLILRPPQYNRTPSSILSAMLSYNKTKGIQLFPDFLEKLILNRTGELVRNVKIIEWKIKKELALLNSGALITKGVMGLDVSTFLIENSDKNTAALQATPRTDKEKKELKKLIQSLNADAQKASSQQTGIFTAKKQKKAQEDLIQKLKNPKDIKDIQTRFSKGEQQYKEANIEISKLTGMPSKSFQTFDSIRIGAMKNGVASPASDIASIIGKVSSLVSQRSKLLSTLRRSLQQATEYIQINEGGATGLITHGAMGVAGDYNKKSEIYKKLVVDDQANILGHLSGKRFIIDDDVIYSYNFDETPPEFTMCEVTGTDPLVGDKLGNNSGVPPIYTAFGVDFDLWRQYGWRQEATFNKPFFWSAEQQCAPYAKMLLSRQRKNIVKGSVSRVGNEFYQLGDVVYVASRQMLYYVNTIHHNFTIGSDFKTTLDLTYGHSPGEYIPTPLDIIGKSMSYKNDKQSSFRIRRFGPGMGPSQDTVIATVKFSKDGSSISDLLNHNTGHGKRNYEVLLNSLRIIGDAKNKGFTKEDRPKIIISYFGDSDDAEAMLNSVESWLKNPNKGASTSNNILTNDKLTKYAIDVKNMIIEKEQVPYECMTNKNTPTSDRLLIRNGSTASPTAYTLDNTLKTVVEIRLRRPPAIGWPSGKK